MLKVGDRIRIGPRNRSLLSAKGATGYVDHAVPELDHVYPLDHCWAIRLDDHSAHIQWESELELETLDGA